MYLIKRKPIVTALIAMLLSATSYGYVIFTGGPVFDYTKYPQDIAKLLEQIQKTKALSNNITQLIGQVKTVKGILGTELAAYDTLGNAASMIYDKDKTKLINVMSKNLSNTFVQTPSDYAQRATSITGVVVGAAQLGGLSSSNKVARANTLRQFNTPKTGAATANETQGMTVQDAASSLQDDNMDEQAVLLNEISLSRERSQSYRAINKDLSSTPSQTVLDAGAALKNALNINTSTKIENYEIRNAAEYQRLHLLNSKNTLSSYKNEGVENKAAVAETMKDVAQ